jgi:2-polyprenyl-3-methyl-5-hydroxy-6-metoxy-1,4-benzoquinol methylase
MSTITAEHRTDARLPETAAAGAGAARAYDLWHTAIVGEDHADSPWHRLIRRHLDPARDLAGRRVLEIGCGRGGFSRWLASADPPPAEVCAADFSEAAVRRGEAAARAAPPTPARLVWSVGDIQAIDHPAASFDTVFSCETIEHVPDPRRAVRELARVLRPGGRLFLTTPNYLSLTGLYRLYVTLSGRTFTECGQPINNLTMLTTNVNWVIRAGLRVTAVDGAGHYLPVPGRPPVRIPALDSWRPLRWLALHGLVVAEKP